MIVKFKKIIDLDKGLVEIDNQEIIKIVNEKQKEKTQNYVILSFIDNKSKVITKRLDSGRYIAEMFSEKDLPFNCSYGDGYGATLEEMINHEDFKDYSIHSVKRLSDREVFTIGDKIEGYENNGIKEIILTNHGLRIITDANGVGCVTDKLAWKLENCKKN